MAFGIRYSVKQGGSVRFYGGKNLFANQAQSLQRNLLNKMFSNKLLAPLTLFALFFLYLAWKVDEKYAIWMAPFVVAAAAVYILKNEIDWWWYSKNPPEMPAAMQRLIERFSGFYAGLSPADQQLFRHRVELFKIGTDWMPMGWPEDMESVPEDVRTVLAAQAVTLTLHQPVFLMEKFEKVIVYPGPFPTEQYPFAHASELYEPDGCLLFSAEQVIQAFAEPTKWYNVGLHEYAHAFVRTYPDKNWPDFSAADAWERLEFVSKMPKGHVTSVVGLPEIGVLPVAIHHYCTFKEAFKNTFPEESAVLYKIFGH
jgi:hypothetical protein